MKPRCLHVAQAALEAEIAIERSAARDLHRFVEVCLKAPSREVDVVIAAELMTFTKVWLGYLGLLAALASGAISLHGTTRAVRVARRLLALPDQPMLKSFSFSGAAQPAAIAAE
jgi:putative sterol carrier protein